MIKIFDSIDTSFNTNGNIVINPLKLIETKKKSLNGWYINVEIPIEYKEYIQQDKLCVVKTKSKLRPQAFRIGNIEYTQRKIIFTANHVVFDAKDYFLADVRPTELNALNSLKYINERTDNTSPFNIVSSDIESIDTCYFIRKNLLEAWTIIEERYNGIFDADNFDISFNSTIGIDRGEIIVYKKNLQNIKIFEDWSNVCTRIYPVGKDGLMLDSKYIDSEVQYDKPYTKTVDFETELEEEEQTEDNLLKELEEKANKYLLENQQPLVSYEITSDINQLMEIGDKIHVKHPIVNILTEVLEYEFDGISKKIKKIVFGNYTRDVKAKFDNIKSSIENVKIEISNQNKIINKQTEMINSLNKNGYVYIDDNEILILDALPKETAINVWRFGLGGLGFSSSGYKGPFETAITADGSINADFISTGILSASRIEGYDQLLQTVSEMGDTVDKNYTELNQTIDEFKYSVQNAGGSNLIKNSVMFAYDENNNPISWETELDGNLLINSSAEALTSGSLSGHVFTLNNKIVRQKIEVKISSDDQEPTYYTFSTKIKKDVTGNCYVKIYNSNEEYLIKLLEGQDSFYSDYEIKGLLPKDTYYIIEFYGSDDSNATFTDNMFSVGEYRSQWSQANGEIMNTQVNINENGVLVKSSIYQGDYTVMSPLEFAGYSKINGVITKVFSLNKDTTLVKKMESEDEIKMIPIKIVPITSGDLQGWAFVPSTGGAN